MILALVGVVTLMGLVAFAVDTVIVDLEVDPPVFYQELPFVNNCERQADESNWIYAVTIDPAMRTDDFQLFGLSASGTVVTNCPPICSGAGPYHSNVCAVAATGPALRFDSEKYCVVECYSDDDGYFEIGDIAAASALGRPGRTAGYLAANVAHAQRAGFNSIGGPYAFNCAVTISAADPTRPRLDVSPAVIRVSPKTAQAVADGKFHTPRMLGVGDDTNSYTIACAAPPAGVKILNDRLRWSGIWWHHSSNI